jgi:hypothetical protein
MRCRGCLLAVVMLAGAGVSEGQKPPRQPTPAIVAPLATAIQNFIVSPGTVSFAASDPDSPSHTGSSTVTWNLTGGSFFSNWTLRVASVGSWFGGGSASCSTVPASAVTFRCASATFSGGTLPSATCSAGTFTLSTTYQTVASGREGSGTPSFTVTVSFTLLDSWSYVANLSPPCTLSVSYSLNAP